MLVGERVNLRGASTRVRVLVAALTGGLMLAGLPGIGEVAVAAATTPAVDDASPVGAFCAGAPAASFNDLEDESDVTRRSVGCLVAAEVARGISATEFAPGEPVSRRQMAAFIARLGDLLDDLDGEDSDLDRLPDHDGSSRFSDVAPSDSGAAPIGRLQRASIVGGLGDGSYRPNAPVTRRQMAAFVARLIEYLDAALAAGSDHFRDDNGDSGEELLNAAAEAGIFLGDGSGNVLPGEPMTRRQMADVLVRVAQYFFAQGTVSTPFPTTPPPTGGGGGGAGGGGGVGGGGGGELTPHDPDEPLELLDPSAARVSDAKANLTLGVAMLRDQVLVMVEPGTSRAIVDSLADLVGGFVVGGTVDSDLYQFGFSSTPIDFPAIRTALRTSPMVLAVMPTIVDGLEEAVAGDFEDYDDDGEAHWWHNDLIRAFDAWEARPGGGGLVRVIDGGRVDPNHEDLAVLPLGDGLPAGVGSHATHVGGLACSETNALGLVGSGGGCFLQSMPAPNTDAMIERLGRTDHPHVVNMSMGLSGLGLTRCAGGPPLIEYDILKDKYFADYFIPTAEAVRKSPGTLFVISAGNGCNQSIDDPFKAGVAHRSNVLLVASVNASGDLSSFSAAGTGVDIGAPGGSFDDRTDGGNRNEGVFSTVPGNGYDQTSGTSMASPVVAGTAALVRSQHPSLSASAVADCLIRSARLPVGTRSAYPQGFSTAGSQPGPGGLRILDVPNALDCAAATVDGGGGSGGTTSGGSGPFGGVAGDPHLRSFDGLLFDMQAEGEFLFTESLDDDFAVHVRTKLSWGVASSIDEFAVRTPAGEIVVYDGEGVAVNGVTVPDGEEAAVDGTGYANPYSLRLADGTTVSWSGSPAARTVRIHLAASRIDRVRGLLGEGDGSVANDGTTAGGEQLIGPGALDGLTDDEILALLYDEFAPTWITNDADRLFSIPKRPYVKPTGFTRISDFTGDEVQTAEERCRSNGWIEPELSFCIFDLLVTGDESFADPSNVLGLTPEETTSSGGEPQLDDDRDTSVVRGRAVDAGGAGQAGICISVFGDADDGSYTYGYDTTEADGSYEVVDLPDGAYRVRANDCNGLDRVGGYHPGMSTYTDAEVIELDGGFVNEIDLLIAQGGAISGVLTQAEGGIPLSWSEGCVRAFPVDGDTVSQYEFSNTGGSTDGEGDYRLGSLLPGDYVVQASPCSWAPEPLNLANTWFDGAGHHADAVQVTVAASQVRSATDIALPPGATVTGTIDGPDGLPAGQVCLSGYTSFDPLGSGRFATTGDDGTYSLTGLSAGETTIYVNDCGDRDYVSTRLAVTALGATEVRTGVDAELEQGGRITGTVVRGLDLPRRLCADASSPDGGTGVQVSPGQAFAITGLRPGSYRVSFRDCDDYSNVIEWWQDSSTQDGAIAVLVSAGEVTGPLHAVVG